MEELTNHGLIRSRELVVEGQPKRLSLILPEDDLIRPLKQATRRHGVADVTRVVGLADHLGKLNHLLRRRVINILNLSRDNCDFVGRSQIAEPNRRADTVNKGFVLNVSPDILASRVTLQLRVIRERNAEPLVRLDELLIRATRLVRKVDVGALLRHCHHRGIDTGRGA